MPASATVPEAGGALRPPGMALAAEDLHLAPAEGGSMPAASPVHDRLVGLAARGWSGLD